MNGIKKRWQSSPKWARIIGMVILGLAAAVLFGFIFGYFVQLLWNALIPDLFGLKEITYWQAFGIVVLARLIFGCSLGGDNDRGPKSARDKKRQWSCKDEREDIKGEWKNWRYYDDWWDEEGKNSFEGYVDKKTEEKENLKDKS